MKQTSNMMKYGTVFTIILFFWLNVFANLPSQKNGYSIKGRMEGLKEGEKVLMSVIHNDFGRGGTPMDSARVKNGLFEIAGYVTEGPQYYALTFEKHPSKVVRLLIDNMDNIIIQSTDIEKINHDVLDDHITVYGSITNRIFHDFIPTSDYYYQFTGVINNEHYLKDIKDSVGFDSGLVGGILAARRLADESLFYLFLDAKRSPDTSTYSGAFRASIPFLVYLAGIYDHGRHPAILGEIYDRLDEKAKGSYYGKRLKQQLPLCSGQPFPSFSLPDSQGKIISLGDILVKNKVTLVHFWAANSVYRKQYQDELKTMYKKYHGRGFDIIGISSDDSATEYSYRKVLREQTIPWNNVCDLRGKEGIVETVYHEFGNSRVHNTTNVLIGTDGKIIAWDPTGLELQWYLWRYLGE